MDFARGFAQIQFMIVNQFQRIKRDSTQGNNYPRIDQLDSSLQKIGTVSYFAGGGATIRARAGAWVTQGRAGDEYLRALEANRRHLPRFFAQ